jgi:hypothetical protein
MPVTDVQQDLDTLTLTITADFTAPVQRIWQIYADPRQLEKVGSADLPGDRGRPRPHPRRPDDLRHDRPGRRQARRILADHGRRRADEFLLRGRLRRPGLHPTPGMPVSQNIYTFTEHDGDTRATYVSTYQSAEALQQVLDMGMVEGATLSINQIDDLIAS